MQQHSYFVIIYCLPSFIKNHFLPSAHGQDDVYRNLIAHQLAARLQCYFQVFIKKKTSPKNVECRFFVNNGLVPGIFFHSGKEEGKRVHKEAKARLKQLKENVTGGWATDKEIRAWYWYDWGNSVWWSGKFSFWTTKFTISFHFKMQSAWALFFLCSTAFLLSPSPLI